MTTSMPRGTRATALSLALAALTTASLASASPASAETATYEVTTPSLPGAGVGASLLDPGTIGLCNAGFGDVSVASWETGIGHVDLFCGDGKSGFATGSIVMSPTTGFPKDEGDGKLCCSAPILIENEEGNVVDTHNPTVIVSANNKKIITSFPTHLVDNCG